MEIREATSADKESVLKIIDKFTYFINSQKETWDGNLSTTAKDNSGYLFDEMINLNKSNIFIALENKEVIGFLEIHKVPRFRRSKYYGEIEGMYVEKNYYGKGIAQSLMQLAYGWAKAQNLDCIRLYSGPELGRAHAFYKKMGFDEAGITFKNYNFQ